MIHVDEDRIVEEMKKIAGLDDFLADLAQSDPMRFTNELAYVRDIESHIGGCVGVLLGLRDMIRS